MSSALRPVMNKGRNARPSNRVAALLLAGAAALAVSMSSRSFVVGHQLLPEVTHSARARLIPCHAEPEAPPSDDVLTDDGGVDPRPDRRWKPKRERPGKLCYARRELNEEAERLRPYIEPLLEKQLSLKELTFVLNRMGSKLRHLLYKPRLGLPVFTEHKVRRLLRRAKNDDGIRLNKFVRPLYIPPFAPGAYQPDILKPVYSEVPPLRPKGAPIEAEA